MAPLSFGAKAEMKTTFSWVFASEAKMLKKAETASRKCFIGSSGGCASQVLHSVLHFVPVENAVDDTKNLNQRPYHVPVFGRVAPGNTGVGCAAGSQHEKVRIMRYQHT